MARFSTATHWGAYGVETQDGEVVSMEPFPEDPDPSLIGFGMPQAIKDPVRIEQPMIRKSWLDSEGKDSSIKRGEGQYVAVSWEKAIKLVAIANSCGFAVFPKNKKSKEITNIATTGYKILTPNFAPLLNIIALSIRTNGALINLLSGIKI